MLEPQPPHEGSATTPDATSPSLEELSRASRFSASLQRTAAVLASPLERAQVVDAIMRSTVDALGAAAGAVAEMSDDGDVLSVVAAVGYDDALVQHFARIRVSDFPVVVHLVRARDRSTSRRRRSSIASRRRSPASPPTGGARVALPLATSERFVGVLVLTFAEARDLCT